MTEVNQDSGNCSSATIKFVEPCHTFMSSDAFHHQVEQGMREQKKVEDFQDFQDIINKKGESVVKKVEDFFDIPKGVSSAKFALSKPKLKDVLMVKFERGTQEIF